ncbi:MAG: GNAT family N-acetyltransferase [Chloroflexota bacterium]|nr:GNAT family N-acetyltransferase [Chloroflexota bacterium]
MIEIRQATSEDLAALISLYEQLEDMGAAWSDVKFSTKDKMLSQKVLAHLKDYPDYNVYVAEADGKIVGTLALFIIDSVPNGIPSAIVENVVVSRTWRRKGVGRQLMQFAIDQSRSKGCYEITLSSRMNNEAAHRFYKSLGLREKGYTFALKTLPS